MDGFKIQYLRINNRVILGQNSLFVSKNLPLKLTSCHTLKFIFFCYIFLNYPLYVISVYTINNHNVTQKLTTSRTLRASRMLRAVTAVLLLSLLCTLCSSFGITSQKLFAIKFLPRRWLCFDAHYLNDPQ